MVDLLNGNYDIVIIGAGLAGASTAYFSKFFDKDASKKILLLESLNKEKFTRYHHMCGEAVSKYIENDLPEIDISKFVKNKIDKIVEFWGDEVKIRSKSPGYIIDRSRFILNVINQYKKMGGEFFEDRLTSFSKGRKEIKLKLKNKGNIKTKYLIIATGPNMPKGNISNIGGDVFRSVLYQILVKRYPLEKDCIEFYYDERYKENYKWIFPYGDLVKIGVPFENRGELKSYNKYGIIRKDIKSVCCGILNNYNSNNILFVGDAAFQNNPLTKGGIRNAINAGKMAAESLIKYDDPEKYDVMWKKSRFFTEPYLYTCKKLKKMDNKELIYHSKPFKYFPLSLPLILLKYRKYIPLYKTYISSGKYGW